MSGGGGLERFAHMMQLNDLGQGALGAATQSGMGLAINTAAARIPIPGLGNMIGGALSGYALFQQFGTAQARQQAVRTFTEGFSFEGKTWALVIADLVTSIKMIIDLVANICNVLSGLAYAFAAIAALGGLLSVFFPPLAVLLPYVPTAINFGRACGGIASICMAVSNAISIIPPIFRAIHIVISNDDPIRLVNQEQAYHSEIQGAIANYGSAAIDRGIDTTAAGRRMTNRLTGQNRPPPAAGDRSFNPLAQFRQGVTDGAAHVGGARRAQAQHRQQQAERRGGVGQAREQSAAQQQRAAEVETQRQQEEAAVGRQETEAARAQDAATRDAEAITRQQRAADQEATALRQERESLRLEQEAAGRAQDEAGAQRQTSEAEQQALRERQATLEQREQALAARREQQEAAQRSADRRQQEADRRNLSRRQRRERRQASRRADDNLEGAQDRTRAAEAEAQQARQDAEAAQQRATEQQQLAQQAEARATAAGERAQAAQTRATEAAQRATAAEQAVRTAERTAEASGQQSATEQQALVAARARAATARQEANAARQDAATARQQADTALAEARAADRQTVRDAVRADTQRSAETGAQGEVGNMAGPLVQEGVNRGIDAARGQQSEADRTKAADRAAGRPGEGGPEGGPDYGERIENEQGHVQLPAPPPPGNTAWFDTADQEIGQLREQVVAQRETTADARAVQQDAQQRGTQIQAVRQTVTQRDEAHDTTSTTEAARVQAQTADVQNRGQSGNADTTSGMQRAAEVLRPVAGPARTVNNVVQGIPSNDFFDPSGAQRNTQQFVDNIDQLTGAGSSQAQNQQRTAGAVAQRNEQQTQAAAARGQSRSGAAQLGQRMSTDQATALGVSGQMANVAGQSVAAEQTLEQQLQAKITDRQQKWSELLAWAHGHHQLRDTVGNERPREQAEAEPPVGDFPEPDPNAPAMA